MLKACTPVFIMAALFAAGMKKPTTKLIASIAIITTGTCIASYGEVNFNVVGVLVMVLSNVLNSAQLVLQQVPPIPPRSAQTRRLAHAPPPPHSARRRPTVPPRRCSFQT
jgi:hypothetical protein